MASKIPPMTTRLVGIYFRRTTFVNPNVRRVDTTFHVSNMAIGVILSTVAAGATGNLDHLGSFLAKLNMEPPPPPSSSSTKKVDPVELPLQFVLTYSNLGCEDVDISGSIRDLKALPWLDADNTKLTPTVELYDTLSQEQLVTLLNFRVKLPSCEVYQERTLVMLDREYGSDGGPTATLLNSLDATDQGDPTGSGDDDPQSEAWAKGLFERITTGGPNGSMAGKIAVNFMNTAPVAATFFSFRKRKSGNIMEDTSNPLLAILKNSVVYAAQAAAQGLADYLGTLRKPSINAEGDTDRQIATVVKGIKDSMPATGKTVAQLAVYNALGFPEMETLPQDQQLRIAYTVANSTRAAVEATGNHIADLYQTNSIPSDDELAAVGTRSLLDFLKSVGSTVANGVLEAAPVVLNAVLNSANANNALGSTLPPTVTLAVNGLHQLSGPTKVILASRIVNGTPNPESTVVTDKAISDLANRQSNLGAQATLDTFTNTPTPSKFKRDDPTQEQRDKFRTIALEVADLSPTFSNVTDIGATNLVNDTDLNHADSLRQHTLEMGIRSCANMIANHQSAEILYKVHLYRLKNGKEVQPRNFMDFIKTAVPIAANIAKAAAPALLAML
jgi:hypothetical protein